MKSHFRTKAKDPTHAVFGLDNDGDTYSYLISKGPHWIICGQTGSGKSVFLNSMIISMFFHSHPDELKVIWIDPKKVEAKPYKDVPYCPVDPITNMNDAYGWLLYLTILMDERYEKISKAGVKDLESYNEWVENNPEEAKLKGLNKLPYVVAVIDEYADMVMQTREVEAPLIRLGQKSRASGIHCVIATQRPSADIVTPNLKANIPSRVCLKVADAMNSMIVLDEAGGEKLRGYGDSLVKVDSGITRVQGPFLTDDELISITDYLKENYTASPVKDEDYVNYKAVLVDKGLFEWEEEYDEDVPIKDRKIQLVKRGGMGRYR